ncbi:MAG: histidine phosphatase family protein [Methanosarcina sp.]
MSYLVLVRHAEPGLKPAERLSGWIDIPLSRKGIEEALECAEELRNFKFDLAFASNLVRTQETLFIIFSTQEKTGVLVHEREQKKAGKETDNETDNEKSSNENDRDIERNIEDRIEWYSYPENLEKELIPIYCTPALNERYYGKLQGKKKEKMEEKYGIEEISAWRWNFEPGPPEGESLKAVYERAVPYFEQNILPAVKGGKNVLICAHQSSLRALVKYIERISNENIREIRFSTGELVIYSMEKGKLVRKNSQLSPEKRRNI